MSDAKPTQPDKKGKKGKKGKADPPSTDGLSIAAHARAGTQVRRAKGWGGLVGFAIAAYLSIAAGVPPSEAGMRALAAGVAGYLLAWGCSVTIWRHLVLAELRVAAERLHPEHFEPHGSDEPAADRVKKARGPVKK
jgi:hypothetical protein